MINEVSFFGGSRGDEAPLSNAGRRPPFKVRSASQATGAAGGWTITDASNELIAELGEEAQVAAQITAISPEQICFLTPAANVPPVVGPVPLRLCAGGHQVALHVDAFSEVSPGVLAARVVAPTRTQAQALLSIVDGLVIEGHGSVPQRPPLVREVIDDPDQQREIVESMVRNGCEGMLRIGGVSVGRAVPLRTTKEGIVFSFGVVPIHGPFTIELVGYNSLYSIDVTNLRPIDGGVVVVPVKMVHLRNRAFRRVAPPSGTYLEFAHPRWPGLHVRRSVREISAQGLSFQSGLQEDLLYPGLRVADAVLHVDGQVLSFSGEVRSLTRDASSGHYHCGFQLSAATAADETWQAILEECLHATTRMGRSWARPTWELYERAGYFDLSGKEPSAFGRLFDAFDRVSAKIEKSPSIGCQVVWPHDEQVVEGAMSMLKVYSSSWLVFQLAKVTGPTRRDVSSRQVLRDLHLHCYEHAQRDVNLRWLVGIPQVKATWSRSVHYDFPHRYLASGKAAIVRFRAVEVPCRGESAPWLADLQIGEATPRERALLVKQIVRTRPSPYVDALDLGPKGFALTKIREVWNQSGFCRKRTVLVARVQGRPIAAALLESADDGLHLFRLLDAVRLYPLASGGERQFGALLAAARGWYAAQHKDAFVAFLEDEVLPAGSPAGTTDLGLADFVILSAAHLPELLEHVYVVTAPRGAPQTQAPPSRSTTDELSLGQTA